MRPQVHAQGCQSASDLRLEMTISPKPCNPRELLVRVKSVFRRVREMPAGSVGGEMGQLRFSGWC